MQLFVYTTTRKRFVISVCRSTPNNSNLEGKLKQVRFNGSLKQITGSKEISKWMGWGGERNAIKQQSIQGWTLNLNWSDKKVKTKN